MERLRHVKLGVISVLVVIRNGLCTCYNLKRLVYS